MNKEEKFLTRLKSGVAFRRRKMNFEPEKREQEETGKAISLIFAAPR